MNRKGYCNSCKKKVTNLVGSTSFKCPKCDSLIVRCYNCRQNGTRYDCGCSFSGPN